MPLDCKQLVTTYEKLLLTDTWSGYAYNGMIVGVGLDKSNPEKNGIYYLYDANVTNALGKPDVTVESNWHKLGELSEINNIAARVSALEENSGGVDEDAVNQLITAQIDALREEIIEAGYLTASDLENYATKDEVAQNTIDGDKVIKVDSVFELPNSGKGNYFYVAKDTGLTYVFDEKTVTYKPFAINEHFTVKTIDGGSASSSYSD